VRHNEEQINQEMQSFLPLRLPSGNWESPHTKTHLLYQAHFSRMEVPMDYYTDLRSILEACIRIVQAMFDYCLVYGWLDTALCVIVLLQQIAQGRWYYDHPLLCLPNTSEPIIDALGATLTIPQYQDELGMYEAQFSDAKMKKVIKQITQRTYLEDHEAKEFVEALTKWPVLKVAGSSLQQGLTECPIDLLSSFKEDVRKNEGIQLKASTEYKMRVRLELNGPNRFNPQAYCPKYPKEKTAGWIVLLGNKETGQIYASQKVPPILGSRDVRFYFKSPGMPGHYTLTLFVMSDAYLGIDQEYGFSCRVTN
jgi:activating signal cointegrator complex subunit 3